VTKPNPEPEEKLTEEEQELLDQALKNLIGFIEEETTHYLIEEVEDDDEIIDVVDESQLDEELEQEN
tara:strand:+ start:2571 stop:2771 length:201 start_codon:yes stop_codon:yes gene_type:complete